MRPLGIPSFEDKLVQEVVRMILEAIYEGYLNTPHMGLDLSKAATPHYQAFRKGLSGLNGSSRETLKDSSTT